MTRGRRLEPAAALAVALAVALAALTPRCAAAQDARVHSEVDTTRVTVGDRIRLTVSVEHAAGARVQWPDSLALDPFEVLGAQAVPPQARGDRVVEGAVLTLTTFELGALEIPSFDVQVVGPGEQTQTVTTDRFGIEVVSVGAADEGGDIRDIRGPLLIPVGVLTVSVWVLVLLVAAAMAVWLFRRFRRRGGEGEAERGPPPRLPHEVALEALARIEASPMLERGQVKEYHIEVSETLRRYVEARFRVPALEMTTREVTEGLLRAGVAQTFRDGLRAFLDQCDLVKFAKVRPAADASRAVLAAGRRLVEESIPRPEPEPAADDNPAGADNPAAAAEPAADVEVRS